MSKPQKKILKYFLTFSVILNNLMFTLYNVIVYTSRV